MTSTPPVLCTKPQTMRVPCPLPDGHDGRCGHGWQSAEGAAEMVGYGGTIADHAAEAAATLPDPRRQQPAPSKATEKEIRQGEPTPTFNQCVTHGLTLDEDWHDRDGKSHAECLSKPSTDPTARLYQGARRYANFKRLLHEHREDALECHDHPEYYCCVCGEHMALGYTEHLAAVLANREAELSTGGDSGG